MRTDAHRQRIDSRRERTMSRRAFLGGMAAGAAGVWGLSHGLARLADDPARPPELYEFYLDNFWFKAADLEHEALNAPLKGDHKADIVIIGGGFTGLSAAYNLSRMLPNKKIVLLEGACCGYGASGRQRRLLRRRHLRSLAIHRGGRAGTWSQGIRGQSLRHQPDQAADHGAPRPV